MKYSFNLLKSEYRQLYDTMELLKERYPTIAYVANKIYSLRNRYNIISNVPYIVIGCIHYREANFNFSRHLHNGDPLTWYTINTPKGRPVEGKPPFRWEDSARDAIELACKNIKLPKQWTVEYALWFLERYNGFGYRNKGINTPYLWSGSNHYKSGKYVRDGKFDINAVDKQIGCACIIKYAIAHDLTSMKED